MESVPDESSLSSDQDTNQFFWCRRGLNSRSLIQPSDTLPVELTGTRMHMLCFTYTHELNLMFLQICLGKLYKIFRVSY